MNPEIYREAIRPLLSDKRYHHSICVAAAAKDLAQRYGSDVEKAETAGILHDIMKDIPQEKQLELMRDFGIELTRVERSAPKLWHAVLGAAYLKNKLKIEDTEILEAVRYHTTGRAGMTLLDKVLFIADFISADRNYDGVEELRKAASMSLEQAMIEGLAFTIADLAGMRKAIHPDTLQAYNEAALRLAQSAAG